MTAKVLLRILKKIQMLRLRIYQDGFIELKISSELEVYSLVL